MLRYARASKAACKTSAKRLWHVLKASRLSGEAEAQKERCEVCHYPEWIEGLPKKYYRSIHFWNGDVDKLIANATSADARCPGCEVMLAAMDMVYGEESRFRANYIALIEGQRYLRMVVADEDYKRSYMDLYTVPGEASLPGVRTLPQLPVITNLNANLVNIKKWLESCEQDHPACCSSKEFVPKRLLEVRSCDDTVYLVEPPSPTPSSITQQFSRYACLSHCWGQTRSKHITRHSNYSDNVRGIPITELPATFRDAIKTTRAPRVDYLWIDSLCIIQDDDADWNLHVGVMADVYRNAYITLAAGASIDDDGGFFGSTNEKHTKIRVVKRGGKSCDTIDLHLRLAVTHPHASDSYSTSPLEQRGWVFQERLLSRRFLCFDKNEIQWECLEDVACTCSSVNGCFNSQYNTANHKPAFPRSRPIKWELARLKDLDSDAIQQCWGSMVEVYSQKALTFPKDKLPALAGLAKAFAEASNDTYIYGHWRKNLPRELLWRRERGDATLGRPERDVPSWSWPAAADGAGIRWDDEFTYKATTVEITDVVGKLLTLNGYVSTIDIKVSTEQSLLSKYPLSRKCSVSRSDEQVVVASNKQDQVEEVAKSSTLALQCPESPQSELRADELNMGESFGAWFYADYRFWTSEEELQAQLVGVYLLGLTSPASGEDHDVCGMILRKTGAGTFERFGRLDVYWNINKYFKKFRGRRQNITIS